MFKVVDSWIVHVNIFFYFAVGLSKSTIYVLKHKHFSLLNVTAFQNTHCSCSFTNDSRLKSYLKHHIHLGNSDNVFCKNHSLEIEHG